MAYTPASVPLPRNLDPAFATTDDIMAAASITRSTVKVWAELGLLPQPIKMSLSRAGGVFNRYPARAVEQARFVAEKRAAGFTYDEIRVMLASLAAQAAPRGQGGGSRRREAQRRRSEAAEGRGEQGEPWTSVSARSAPQPPVAGPGSRSGRSIWPPCPGRSTRTTSPPWRT
jgi:DNA-binding transcriptional MerR regulator